MKDASATPKGICRSWLEIGAIAQRVPPNTRMAF